MNEEFQNLIDQYISGEMTKEETLEFEKELDSNVELKEQFEFTKTAQKTLKIHDFDEKLGFIKGLEESEEKVVPVVNIRKRIYWISGLAASVLLISMFFWNEAREEHLRKMEIIEKHFVHYPSGVERDRLEHSNIELSTLRMTAYDLYDSHEYKNAAQYFERLYFEERDTVSIFYAGVAWLGAGDLGRASEIFNKNEIRKIKDVVMFQEIVKKIKKDLL